MNNKEQKEVIFNDIDYYNEVFMASDEDYDLIAPDLYEMNLPAQEFLKCLTDYEKHEVVPGVTCVYYTLLNPWIELEEKYNIRFKNDDGSFRTVDEWLDDLYLQCPSCAKEMLEEIFLRGDELFAHLTEERNR